MGLIFVLMKHLIELGLIFYWKIDLKSLTHNLYQYPVATTSEYNTLNLML